MTDAEHFVQNKERMLELRGLWMRSAPVKTITWEKERDPNGEITENIFLAVTFLDESQIIIRDGQIWIRPDGQATN